MKEGRSWLKSRTYRKGVTIKLEKLLGSVHRTTKELGREYLCPKGAGQVTEPP